MCAQDYGADPHAVEASGSHAFSLAAVAGNHQHIAKWMARFPAWDLQTKNHFGCNALHDAVSMNAYVSGKTQLRLLITMPLHHIYYDHNSRCYLSQAYWGPQKLATIKALIEHGSDLRPADSGSTVLSIQTTFFPDTPQFMREKRTENFTHRCPTHPLSPRCFRSLVRIMMQGHCNQETELRLS